MKKAALIHYSGNILSALGALAGVSLLSHLVPADIYGIIALYIAFATLFQHVIREALSNALMRHSPEILNNKHTAITLARNSAFPILLCYGAICFFCLFWISSASPSERILSFALILVMGLIVAGEGLLSALLKRGAYAVHLNLAQWLRFPLAAVFFCFFSRTPSALLFGFILAFSAAFAFDLYIFKTTAAPAQPNPTPEASGLNIFRGFTPMLIGFLIWFATFYDRIAIERIRGEETLGVYFVLIQIAYMPIIILMRSTANFLFPLLYHRKKRGLNPKMIFLIFAALFAGWLILNMTHQWLFSWLVGEQYRSYSWLLPWLFLTAVLNAVAYLLQAKFYQPDAMKTLLKIRTVTALVCGFTVTLLAWLYGIVGLVFANVCTSVVLMLLSVYFGRNYRFKEQLNRSTPGP